MCAKLYKVRIECKFCKKVFFARYSGSLYCTECKVKYNMALHEDDIKKYKDIVKKNKLDNKEFDKELLDKSEYKHYYDLDNKEGDVS